jgi:malto-oligosyltrehalose synthase
MEARKDHRRTLYMIPRATVRLQFHRGFTFADAQALVPYFARLGISHLYASPIGVARPGSLHGYDVTDPTRVNPELGGEAALRMLAAALAGAGLGLVLDTVPNHMAADSANPWWVDVLRQGRASRYAQFFDIDWEADDKVLLPILGRPLEEAIAAGEVEVIREEGTLRYFSHRLPLTDGTTSIGSLSELLARQHYRLSWWRSASDRINWRRFFDINELVCLRIEEPEVFEAVHALPLRLHAEGLIDGLRIDHIDGLTDPAAYCRKLRQRLGPQSWLVVEKILLRGERLPVDWACDGTTGYDFMNDVSALQHEAAGESRLATAWASLSGRAAGFAAEEQAARREIMGRSFGAQLDACAAALVGGELARPLLRRVLAELLSHFPVYRTYGTGGAFSSVDRAVLRQAADGARKTCLASDRWAIDAVLRLFEQPSKARAVARFQQLSAPIAAKSVEDTAFYRYGRLISRNDVGFDVETFSLSSEDFHSRVLARARDHPHALLATATHDHKRGEDVRARLAVLSEMADEWTVVLGQWIEQIEPLRRAGEPSAGDIAMLLQTVVGAWPLDLDVGDRDGRAAFADRLAAWQQKALREAKLCSDWAAVNQHYESAARDLVLRLVAEGELPGLLAEIATLVNRIAPAGALNGLAQCLLRLTVPGVPDLYQGTEFWDFSLVDPDNRRPVDFGARVSALGGGDLPALASHWRDGHIKQALIARLLDLRRRKPALFAEGGYVSVPVEGARASSVISFARRHAEDWLLAAVPRLPLALLQRGADLMVSAEAWQDTALQLESLPGEPIVDLLSNASVELIDGRAPLARLCTTLPFLLLTTRG